MAAGPVTNSHALNINFTVEGKVASTEDYKDRSRSQEYATGGVRSGKDGKEGEYDLVMEEDSNDDDYFGFVDCPTSNFLCDYPGCKQIIKHRKHYKDHYRTHTGEKPYGCKECGKMFGRPFHLKRHQAIHTTNTPFNCDYENCSYSCKLVSNLKRHVKRVHESEKPYKCSKSGCASNFKKHKEKKLHELLHDGEKPFKCEEDGCDKCFASYKSLKDHLKRHKKDKGYSCTNGNCNSIFHTWTDLQKHMFMCKVHKCSSCGKIFRAAWMLKKHEVIHDSNRILYACPVENCDRKYTTESNVVAHVRSCHQEERTFKCPEESCGQTFAHKCSLKRHLANHERILEMYKRAVKNKKKREKKRRQKGRVHASTLSKVTGIIPELKELVSDSDTGATSEDANKCNAMEEVKGLGKVEVS